MALLTIPYTIYFEDGAVHSGSFQVEDGKQQICSISIPQTVAGSILRVELGETEFDFHVINAKALAHKTGRNTELEWVNVHGGEEVR